MNSYAKFAELMTKREIGAESRGRMITAELAILRELAFRRKVFLLRSQHDDGLERKEKGLAPLQVSRVFANVNHCS